MSDNDLLFKVIEANLIQMSLQVERFTPPSNGNLECRSQSNSPVAQEHPKQLPADACDLIILAISEPQTALLEADLSAQLGQRLLLIISEQNYFPACQQKQILHMSFPFNSIELRQKVQSLLGPTPSLAGGNA